MIDPYHAGCSGREIQALSQTGYHYSENDYQRSAITGWLRLLRRWSQNTAIWIAKTVDLYFPKAGMPPRVDVRGVFLDDASCWRSAPMAVGPCRGWADVGDVPPNRPNGVWESWSAR
jgi:hypothetical protein